MCAANNAAGSSLPLPEFVDPQAKEGRTCPVCTEVLCQPMQTACGHRLCESCLEDLLAQNKSPRCPVGDDDCVVLSMEEVHPDFSARKDLKKLLVYCAFKKYGCKTMVKSQNYNVHAEDCAYGKQDTPCPFHTQGCNQICKRIDVHAHQEICKYRLEKCPKCSAQIAKSKLEEHVQVCGKVKCPRGCGQLLDPNNFQEHIQMHDRAARYPAGSTARSSNNAGSGRQSARSVASNSLEVPHTETSYHPGVSREREWGEQSAEVDVADGVRNTYIASGETGPSSVDSALGSTPGSLSSDVSPHLNMLNVRLAEGDLRLQMLETASYNGILMWKICGYNRRKADARSGKTISLYSQPFYTSPHGYKMCARVYLNGDGTGKNTHLSLFFVVMKGVYDALLPWPFRQKVTLMLLDQVGKRHLQDTFRPDPASSSFKKPQNEMNVASGCPLFVAHTVLEADGTPYIRDETIFIKVVVDTEGLEAMEQ